MDLSPIAARIRIEKHVMNGKSSDDREEIEEALRRIGDIAPPAKPSTTSPTSNIESSNYSINRNFSTRPCMNSPLTGSR